MEIRNAQRKDIKEIVRLCKSHAAFERAAFDISNKEELLSNYLFNNSNTLKCLVVEDNSQLVGYATFMKQFSTWEAEHYIYLDCLFFIKTIRGKGLGTLMMDRVKKYARKEGCKLIQWQTPNFNGEAIQFYKKLGVNSKTKERFFWTVE